MNPLPTLPLIEGALFVSSTFLDLPCPREQQHYKLDARVPNEGGAGMLFGSHLHEALAMWYRLEEYGLTEEEKLSRVATILTNAFTEKPQAEGDWRNLNWAETVFRRYVDKYRGWDMEVMRWKEPQQCKRCEGKGYKQPPLNPIGGDVHEIIAAQTTCLWCNGTGRTSIMSEVPFVVKLMDYRTPYAEPFLSLKLETLPIYFHGFIDLLVRNPAGNIFPLDFKTSSILGQQYWDGMRASPQLKGYSWAVQNLLGIRPHGYIIHALRTSSPPAYMTNNRPNPRGETKQIKDWWEETITHERFDLGDGELSEWHRNAQAQVESFLWHYSRGYFPQQKSLCTRRYGKCSYFDVCQLHPASDRPLLLASDQFRTKDPISHVIQNQ